MIVSVSVPCSICKIFGIGYFEYPIKIFSFPVSTIAWFETEWHKEDKYCSCAMLSGYIVIKLLKKGLRLPHAWQMLWYSSWNLVISFKCIWFTFNLSGSKFKENKDSNILKCLCNNWNMMLYFWVKIYTCVFTSVHMCFLFIEVRTKLIFFKPCTQ